MTLTYDKSDAATRTLINVQETRSSNFDSLSGVAGDQTIVTYSDINKSSIIEAKTVHNETISSGGNIGKSYHQ